MIPPQVLNCVKYRIKMLVQAVRNICFVTMCSSSLDSSCCKVLAITFFEQITKSKYSICLMINWSISKRMLQVLCSLVPGGLTLYLVQRQQQCPTEQANSKQQPAEERYSTLSAMTKPTLKKMLQAGRKGTTSSTSPRVRVLARKILFIQTQCPETSKFKTMKKKQTS